MPRVALITGASRGIGAATARVLAERGFRVVVNHRASGPQAKEVVADITAAGGEAIAIQADVTVPGDISAMADGIAQRWGGVDVLVHNALIPFVVTSFADLTWEQLGGKLDRELHAAYSLTKAVVPEMVSRGYGRLCGPRLYLPVFGPEFTHLLGPSAHRTGHRQGALPAGYRRRSNGGQLRRLMDCRP
jgi:NAD(P)-dependent dehydrogenase (short-subunit alcohol dehydrogenase family)